MANRVNIGKRGGDERGASIRGFHMFIVAFMMY